MAKTKEIKITNQFFDQNNTPDAPLVKLCKCNGLPTKTSYWLSRLLQKLESLHKVYNGERKKLIEKWCDKKDDKPDEENGQYKLTAHAKEFNEEYLELLNIELEIDMKMIEIPLDTIPTGVLNSFDYGRLSGIIDFKEV